MHVHGGQRFFLAGRWELVAILERKGGLLTQFMSKEAKPMRKDEEEGRGGRVARCNGTTALSFHSSSTNSHLSTH
jgi:hypothetical protein